MTQIGVKPVYRAEVWKPEAGSALYTFGNTGGDTPDVLNWCYKDILTDGVGYFAFTVPTVKGAPNPYYYTDIDLFDLVKIKHGYDTLPGTYNFIGRIYQISQPLSVEDGYVRIISGLSQGEILLRRLKKNFRWQDADTSSLILQLAVELGIGHLPDIEDEFSHPTITVESETYFDLIRRISDYWIDSKTQIKFDFFVGVDGHLHWKSRPIRDTNEGVPTFTVGTDILDYVVTRKLDPVKQNITVYGAAEQPKPADKDAWTDSGDYWEAQAGQVGYFAGPGNKVGNGYIIGYTGAGGSISTFTRTFDRLTTRTINTLYYWYEIQHIGCTLAQCRLLAPDTGSYFYYNIGTENKWYWEEKPLGPNAEYSATTNPNGIWHREGSPNWWDLQGIKFHNTFDANNKQVAVDGLYFYPERWSATATGATTYGVRDLDSIDNTLHSNTECQQRAETLLYQLQDPPIQIEVTTPGDNNILIGDRVLMTIPAENITAKPYDIISVEHLYNPSQGYLSRTTMLNSASIRTPTQVSLTQTLANLRRQVRNIATDLTRIG